jgi:hypothetical protein
MGGETIPKFTVPATEAKMKGTGAASTTKKKEEEQGGHQSYHKTILRTWIE